MATKSRKKPSRINRLKRRYDGDKSKIVAKLTGTKDGSGGARKLTDAQLKRIGFGNKFINRIDNKGDGPSKNPSKPKPNKPSGPKFPSIQDFLASDQVYQSGTSDLDWALQQFMIENQAAQQDAQSAFDSAMGYMNFDRGKALEFMKDDFGSRGLVNSGLYPDAVSDYNEEFSMGVADLNRDLASQMRDLGFERTNMQQNSAMQRRDLRQDAVRRRAEELQAKQFDMNRLGDLGGGKKKKPSNNNKKKSNNDQRREAVNRRRKTGVRKSLRGRQ